MITTHKISIDLVRPDLMPILAVVQDDKYSRNLEISLFENRLPFPVPEDAAVLIRAGKPDGRAVVYDTMPDGTVAYSISGNTVTVRLAPQVCTAAGQVKIMVTLLRGDAELSCFAMLLNVHARPQGVPESSRYIHVGGFLPQTASALPGQYLKITAVDDQGKVTGVAGASASGLPEVTAEHNGAFLRVVDGVWTAAAMENAEEVSF